MPYQRDILESPIWWEKLDVYIAEQKRLNADHVQSALMPALHYVQDLFGYIPEKAINHVSQALGVPAVYVQGVASFYSYYSLTPKGIYTCSVCLGTACYVRGSQEILEEFVRQFNCRGGETTEDGLFTLNEARCLGACGQAPVIMINDRIHARVKADDVADIIAQYTALARGELENVPS
jgi:NADH:ubiquinone oxidoreductase subunit E